MQHLCDWQTYNIIWGWGGGMILTNLARIKKSVFDWTRLKTLECVYVYMHVCVCVSNITML